MGYAAPIRPACVKVGGVRRPDQACVCQGGWVGVLCGGGRAGLLGAPSRNMEGGREEERRNGGGGEEEEGGSGPDPETCVSTYGCAMIQVDGYVVI